MIVMKKHWVALLAASSLLLPASAFSEDFGEIADAGRRLLPHHR